MDYLFTLDFKVRDYECDLQGVVNNSVYQNYLEHTRHEFLLKCGINFAELANNGVYLVVSHAELSYKKPLKSGDSFWIGLNHAPKGAFRGRFSQDIYKEDGTLALTSQFTWACITPQGKPIQAQPYFDKMHPAPSEP